MRTFVLTVIFFGLSSVYAATNDKPADTGGVAWGLVAGSPQLIGLTLETHQNQSLRFQGSIGTFILAHSLTGRMVMTKVSDGIRTYLFVGGGVLHIAEGDGGGGRGTTGFVWGGGGVAVPIRSVRLFGEIGIMGGMDQDKGYESGLPSIAMGLIFAR